MWRIINFVLRAFDKFGPTEWLFTFIGVVIVGAICLRGFGSRSTY